MYIFILAKHLFEDHIGDRVDDDVDKLLDLSHEPSTNFLISSTPNSTEQQQHCNSTSTSSLNWSQNVLSSANNRLSSINSTPSILNYCDKITPEQNKAIDVLLSRAIYATSAPLHLVDNPYWIDFFKALRPAYKPPTRYNISNKLLDDEVSRITDQNTICIADSKVLGIMCDGWTNVRNESIVNIVVTTPKPIFYKSLSTGVQRHSGEYLADLIISVIEELGPRKVFGVVTDNAKNMKKAWGIISKKYPHITTYGCVAHGLNLLINDIINLDSFKEIIEDGKEVINNIRRGHITKAIFEQKRKEANNANSMALALPVVTRWGSVVHFLKSLLVNKQIIRSMNVDEAIEKDIKLNVKKTISSPIFWKKIEHFYCLMSPVAKWIEKIESDSPQLSVVPIIFSELKKSFEDTLKSNSILKSNEKHIMEALANRKEFCVGKIHKAANILNPKFLGKTFNSDDHEDAVQFIYQLAKQMISLEIDARKVISDFTHFKSKTEQFSKHKEYLWVAAEDTSAIDWWAAFCSDTELSKIAVKLLSLPATSAAVERTFSIYKDVHSTKRNKLLNERASNLVFIKHNLQVNFKIC